MNQILGSVAHLVSDAFVLIPAQRADGVIGGRGLKAAKASLSLTPSPPGALEGGDPNKNTHTHTLKILRDA